jgi:hypothetical protein
MTNATITTRAKAFSGRGVETVQCMVDTDGQMLVYDSVAKHFTRCHSLSKTAERRIRKLAAASV